MTVKELIEKLKKMPADYKVQVNVDNAYTSYVRRVYIDQYDVKFGYKCITIKV